jgi:hypothetical protein
MEPESLLPYSQAPIPILSKINPVHVSQSHFFKIHFSIILILIYLLTYLLTYSMEQSPSWEATWLCS